MSEKGKPTLGEIISEGYGCMIPGLAISPTDEMTTKKAPTIAVDASGEPQAQLVDTRGQLGETLDALDAK